MKRLAPWTLLFVTLLVVVVPFALAATTPAPAATKGDKSPGAGVATAISTVTGIAISPLLGTAGYGAYQWSVAKDEAARAKLPWYAQPSFWLPALLIVGVCALKDSFGAAVPPGLKKPLDVLETVENKFSGLVAAGAVVPFAIDTVTKLVFDGGAMAARAPELVPSGVAAIQLAAVDFTWLLNLLTVPFGVAIFLLVWLGSHAINVLILLSPWGAIDAALKVARMGLLGLLMLSATINPWLGAALSLVVILVAWLVAGWSFRLTVFGSVYCWDFFTRRSGRFTPKENDNAMFAGGNLPGVPVRTYGRLVQRTEGGLEFFYRPWLWLPEKRTQVPVTNAEIAVGRGLFFSTVGTEAAGTLFLLPPRYRGHEDVLVRAYQLGGGVREAGLRKAWSVVRELFGGGAARPQLT